MPSKYMSTDLVETLSRIERLAQKNAEIIGIVSERQQAMREDMTELKDHQKEANGRMAEVMKDQHETKGAVSMLKWMLSFTLLGIGTGSALAGVILVLISAQ